MLRRKGRLAVPVHQFVADHALHVFNGKLFYLGDLMRGAKAIKKVQERYARFERGGLRDQSKVHGLLNGI
jgi:hypothetical protein